MANIIGYGWRNRPDYGIFLASACLPNHPMSYYNPHELVTKACKACGRTFTAPRYHNKNYCTAFCRKRSKRDRERIRDIQTLPTKASELRSDPRYLTVLENPTKMELDSWAQTLSACPDDKHILITGIVPMWEAPDGVKMVAQQDTNEWVMAKWEASPLDELLFRTAPTPPAIQSENPKLET